MAEASLFVLNLSKEQYEANTHPMLSHVNIGAGRDISIMELARLIARVTGYEAIYGLTLLSLMVPPKVDGCEPARKYGLEG